VAARNTNFAQRERKFPGAKVPRHFRSRERKFQGTKVPGNESSTYGTFAPGSESSWERKFQLPGGAHLGTAASMDPNFSDRTKETGMTLQNGLVRHHLV